MNEVCFFHEPPQSFPPEMHLRPALNERNRTRKMLRKSQSNGQILFDATRVSRHDGFGSKGFMEQLSRVKRSGPGTMIRRPIAKSERWTGSEGKSGVSHGELFGSRLN